MSSSSAARQRVRGVGQKLGERSKVVRAERRHCAPDRSRVRKRGALVRLRCASQQSIAAESQSEPRHEQSEAGMRVSSAGIQTGLRTFNINGNSADSCRTAEPRAYRSAPLLWCSHRTCHSLMCRSHPRFALACSHHSTPYLLRGPRHAVLLTATHCSSLSYLIAAVY